MAIVERRVGKDGTLWGWDDEAGDWLELDETSEQGSTLGNLGRSAVRSFRDIGQGVNELIPLEQNKLHPELTTPAEQRRFAEGQQLQAEQAAAAQTAPIASAIGGAVPEIVAGVGAGLATGGLGLPAAILGQMGAGGAMGFLRPGSTVERATGAALGAVFGLAGEVPAGAQMLKGAMLGLKLGEAVTGRATARSADILDMGLLRAERQAADAAQPGGARSVGAAATPEGELGEQAARENLALETDEATGANVRSAPDEIDRTWAEDNLGYKSPLGAGTHAGSGARMAEAVDEYTFGGSINKHYRAANQKLISRTAAKAAGIPNAAEKEVIEITDLAVNEDRFNDLYQTLERQAPAVPSEDVASAIKPSMTQGGIFEKTKVEKFLGAALESAEQGGVQSGEQMMGNLRRIRQMGTDAAADGDSHGAQQLFELHQRLTDIVERAAEREGRDGFVEEWRRTNQQYRIQKMLSAGASVGATRDVNAKTLLNAMKRDRSKGGFGLKGPELGTPERDLWRLVKLMAKDETNVPATGVRQLLVRGAVKPVAAAAAGATGIYGLGSLLE